MKTTIYPFRKLLLIVCSLFWLSAAQGQVADLFILYDAVSAPDSSVSIYVEIRNEPELNHFEFDISLPPGFDYVGGSSALNPERNCGQVVASQIIPGTNILRTIGLNLVNCPFPGHSGIIMWFSLYTPSTTGAHLLIPENVIVASLWGIIPTANIPATVFILPAGPQAGDVNCDGLVNVNDLVIAINFVLGGIPEPFCFANADLNSDLLVNVADVIGMVGIILQIGI